MLNTFYSVQINALSGPANSDGFIDPTRIEQYLAGGTPPSSLALSITKERANSRFEILTQTLGFVGNFYISNAIATGATANSAATSLTMTVEIERGDSVLVTKDENNAGQTLTGAAALKRLCARALVTGRASDYAEYYDPTATPALTANGATVNAIRVGPRIDKIAVGALANTITEAEAVITVSKFNL